MSEREHVRDYITLSDCYDQLNAALFDGGLVGCVLTFEDKGQHFGYYIPQGFVARDGNVLISKFSSYGITKFISGDFLEISTL
jgi:hypothetical protein